MFVLYNDPDDHHKGDRVWFIVFIIILLLGLAVTCSGQTRRIPAHVDTVYCNPMYIHKYVQIEGSTGKVRTYAIYKDTKNNIQELIPVSKTVLGYIKLCEQNGIQPSLGIRIRNGQISSIIRYKRKIILK